MSDLERFMEQVQPEPTSGCWLWTGAGKGRGQSGYGRFRLGGRTVAAHRASLTLAGTPIPVGMSVCHRCDVPECVNPRHLFVGTHTENMRDAARKGRKPGQPGESNPNAKLTEADVEEVRRLLSAGERQRDIARSFGVTQALVSLINCGRYRKAPQ